MGKRRASPTRTSWGFTTYAGAYGSNALSDEHLHHIHNLILLGQILMLLRARQPAGASRATPVLVAGSNIWKREASATKIAGKGGEEEAKGERETSFLSLSLSLQEKSRLTGCGGGGVDAVSATFSAVSFT